MYNRSSMDWSYPDPEAEWHFDIRKMSAISHILEEKQGSNAAQNSMIAQFFIERFVQFRSARFKGSLHVRPDTLWTYVLNPSRRTSKGIITGKVDVLCLLGAISSLSEKRVFSVAVNHAWFYRILRMLVNVKMKAKCANQLQDDTQKVYWYGRGHSQAYYKWVSFKRIIN